MPLTYTPGMNRSGIARTLTTLAAMALVAGTATLAAPAAVAADTITAEAWGQLPDKVTSGQQVWYPSNTIGMSLHPTTLVTAEPCGNTFTIEALYGGGTAVKAAPSFTVDQVSGGDCDLAPHSYYGKVKKLTTKQGTFVISAGCGWNAKANKPVKGYDGGPCTKADVKSDGGLITLLPKDPTGTSLQVESDGLSYGQLVAIAKGLKPLA